MSESSDEDEDAGDGGCGVARLCDWEDCRKPLHKVLLCAKCKCEAYCSKDCQTKAWKGGHKRECTPAHARTPAQDSSDARMMKMMRGAAQRAARPPVPLTANQERLMSEMERLQAAHNWQGVVDLEREALKLARTLRRAGERRGCPHDAGFIHSALGFSYQSLEKYPKAIELQEQAREIAEGLSDRVGMGKACGNLGTCYANTGKYQKAIERYLESKAIAEELGDRWREANACNDLGFCYGKMGEYAKAIKLYLQSKAMHEELGNPKGVALVCGRLGICYGSTGEYEKAFALQETCKAINEKLGDRWGVAMACSNLGNCFQLTGDYVRARSLYEEQRATFEEMGDRAGVAAACCNLGNCDMRTGDIERALMLHGEHKTIAQELGDLAGVSMACCNIGKCHQSDGNFERALVLHLQAREISETLGHREGVALASSHLGHCHCSLGDYSAAISSYKTQYAVAIEMHLEEMKTRAALGLGVAMRLQLRADLHVPRVNLGMRVGADVEIHSLSRRPELNGVRGKIIEPQDPGTGRCGVKTATGIEVALKTVNIRLVSQLTGPAAGASYVPSPADAASPLFGPPSSLARLEERVQEAAEWLQMALNTGSGVACFHVALLAFDAGHEDKALARLEEYLTWVVENGRQSCAGCQQKRNEQAPMLTCNGCRVVRFCDADHQKMASKNIIAGGNLWQGRHKDICGLLGKWRGVVKNGVSRESLHEDLLAFLRQ